MNYAAAVDIGGTKIAIGIVNEDGHILAQSETPTDPQQGYAAALARAIAVLRSLLGSTGLPIAGIGIGSTGPFNRETGAYDDVGNLPGWQGFSLAADLEREFHLPVAIENDADAAALAEAAWGAGRGSRNLLYLTISTGIGAGLILDGRLYRGAKGAHPEIGHHIVDSTGGPFCYCGAHGCWESLASGPAMESRMDPTRSLSAAQICELARHDDARAQEAVGRTANYLGLGLANMVTTFCPETIVLGGGMMQSADLLLAPAQAIVRRLCTQVPVQNTSIVLAGLGKDSGLLGAASVWFHHRRPAPRAAATGRQPEPWLRGTIAGLHPAAAHLLYTFEQTREELAQFCRGLTTEEVWKSPQPCVATVGYQLRHMAGSIDRLTTYLEGSQLNDAQLKTLRSEHDPGASFDELLAALEAQFRRTESVVRAIPASSHEDPRAVGRKQLPTTVGGLIVHISEHTQRHLGQAVLTAKIVSSR